MLSKGCVKKKKGQWQESNYTSWQHDLIEVH